MKLKKSFLGWILAFFIPLALVLFSALLTSPGQVHAAASTPVSTPTGPDRYTSLSMDITLHEWWLIGWSDNDIYCSFWADHEGLPNDNDILSACGEDIYIEWKYYSLPCGANVSACGGYYLQEISAKPSKKDITVKLPPPQVWISVENCNPDPDGWCSTQPLLVLNGEEPLPNESITGIHGFAGEDPFTCSGARCEFSLEKTDSEGINLQFWALSSYGDTSDRFDAMLRVLTQGGGANDERLVKRWYVDVLSSQWVGENIASCAIAWDSFPPETGLPEWLNTPDTPEKLTSSIPYVYLAGNLINQGVVDVSACPDGGVDAGGVATTCGLEAAEPAVHEWQNQFDKLIIDISQKTDVPAQLLKNLFSRESQFWPGIFREGDDVGLGQLTNEGADTTLLWNRTFYEEFCPLVLDQDFCVGNSYSELEEDKQKLLRAALVNSVDASCANCPLGLDLSRANFSVSVFGRTLLANCEQTGKIVENVAAEIPGRVLDYETLWRFTLVNYNAGPGCLWEALNESFQAGGEKPLSWENVSARLDPACQGAVDYVNDISKPVKEIPTPTPTPEGEDSESSG